MTGHLRSSRWFDTRDVAGLIHRSYLRSEGLSQTAIEGRPDHRRVQLVERAGQLQHALPGIGGGGQARGASGRGAPARVSHHLAGRGAHEADHDDVPKPDGDGCRGDHPGQPIGCGGADRRVRQDRAGAADGGGQRRCPGHHDHRRPGPAGRLPRAADLQRHRPVALHRRCACGAHVGLRVRPARGRDGAVDRSLPGDGHRLHHDLAGGGAGDVAAGHGVDSRGGCTPRRRGRGDRPARGGDGAGGRAAAVAGADSGRLRQCHHASDGSGRVDECGAAPAGAGRPGRGRPAARPVRRDLAAHSGARQCPAQRRSPDRGPVPLRRRAGGAAGTGAATGGRGAHRHRIDAGRDRRGDRSSRPQLGGGIVAATAGGRGRDRRPARLAGSVRCAHQAQRCIARADAPPRPGGRVRRRRRPGGAGSTLPIWTSRPTRCWCCETAGRAVRRGCRSGASCRSRPSCCAQEYPTWCGSRTLA